MRKTLMPTLGLLTVLIFVGWIAVAQSAPATAANSDREQSSAQAATRTAIGIPAIQPRTTTAGPSTPAFTVGDVEQYINNNPMPRNLAINSKPTIVKLVFITSQQASTLLNESVGLPDSTLVCYAELRGTFIFPGPNGATATFQKGYELFDAHTGNLIMVGGR